MTYYAVSDIVAAPGETAYGCLEAATLASGTKVEIPVILVNGVRPGPVLYMQASCHGVELNGIEVLRHVLLKIVPSELSGTLIIIPNANPVGFDHRTRQMYYDMEDINRVWPGCENGSISQRVAYTLWQNAACRADAIIDLHTGSTDMLCHTVYARSDDRSASLARVFGTEVLVEEEQNDGSGRNRLFGKLRNVAKSAGIPSITPELGGQSVLQPYCIVTGIRGVLNVLRHLGMLEGEPVWVPQILVRNAHSSTVHASTGGLFVTSVHAGDRVKRGSVMGHIVCPRTLGVLECVRAPIEGLVVLVWDDPVVHPAGMVAMIGEVINSCVI